MGLKMQFSTCSNKNKFVFVGKIWSIWILMMKLSETKTNKKNFFFICLSSLSWYRTIDGNWQTLYETMGWMLWKYWIWSYFIWVWNLFTILVLSCNQTFDVFYPALPPNFSSLYLLKFTRISKSFITLYIFGLNP